MKQAFLEQVAQYISEHQSDFSGMALVFPNRRAGLYLKKHLASFLEKPVWLPPVFSIDDFIEHISGLKRPAPDDLLFLFFEVYTELHPDKKDTFDAFSEWAVQVLKDYNDIDLNLADAKKVFTYISDSKAIELWNPGKASLSEREQLYLDFFRSLFPLYQKLYDRLLQDGYGYQGMSYRETAVKIMDSGQELPWNHIIFAGFNALTVAEEKIIGTLRKQGKAEVLWDSDHFYLDAPLHEAGFHQRIYFKNEAPDTLKWVHNHYRNDKKSIEITGVGGMVAQVKAAAVLLDKLREDDPDLSSTAVVLGDENLLIPLLNSIPTDVKAMNVTMGLPFAQIPLNTLTESFIQCHIQASKTGKGFYFGHLDEVFRHPYLQAILVPDLKSPGLLSQLLLRNRQVFYTQEQLRTLLSENGTDAGIADFFPDTINPPELCQLGIKLCEALLLKPDNPGPDSAEKRLRNEFVYHFIDLFKTLLRNLEKYPGAIPLTAFLNLYRTSVRQNSFPFYGEPLKGLQIMGMLETRNLDFRHVILLNVNEDIIPRGKSNPGFIPYDVRKEFGLPTHHEGQAVSAYHFYRFLQRPETIHLFYNTEAGKINPGGKSRYILQILKELPDWNPGITVVEKERVSPAAAGMEIPAYQIEKTDAVLQQIRTIAERGLSATSLNSFHLCNLKFYFSKIMRLEEPDEPEEDLDARTFGNILHEVLEKSYLSLIHKEITKTDLESLQKGFDNLLREAFQKHFPQGDHENGKTHLSFEVSRSMLNRFIDTEIQRLSPADPESRLIRIEGLEQELSAAYTTRTGNVVKLYGKIDRIDRLPAARVLIDYKTGFIGTSELTLKNWEEYSLGEDYSKLFQMRFYSLLYSLLHPDTVPLKTGILSFRQLKKGLQFLQYPDDDSGNDESISGFTDCLDELIDTLLNPEIPFMQTQNQDQCKNCSFTRICYRDFEESNT